MYICTYVYCNSCARISNKLNDTQVHVPLSMCLLSETSTDEGITLFAQRHKLQKTLRYLSEDNSVGDLPVYLPKVFQCPVYMYP